MLLSTEYPTQPVTVSIGRMAQQSPEAPFMTEPALVTADGVASGTSPNTPLGSSYQTSELVLQRPMALQKDVRYYIAVC
jgi:hypothetical protein